MHSAFSLACMHMSVNENVTKVYFLSFVLKV